MSILKLKNYLIVTVLLGVSSGYCAEDENEDSFSPPALSRSGSGLPQLHKQNGEFSSEFTNDLAEYIKLELLGRQANEHYHKKILKGIIDLQSAEYTARDSDNISERILCNPVKFNKLLAKYIELEQLGRQVNQRYHTNILEGIRTLQSTEYTAGDGEDFVELPSTPIKKRRLSTPINRANSPDVLIDDEDTTSADSPRRLIRTASAVSIDSSEDGDDRVVARTPTPIDSPRPEHCNSDLEPEYVSDEDDKPKKRGIISAIADAFGW